MESSVSNDYCDDEKMSEENHLIYLHKSGKKISFWHHENYLSGHIESVDFRAGRLVIKLEDGERLKDVKVKDIEIYPDSIRR